MRRLRAEARRRRVPIAEVVRDAIDRSIPEDPGDRLARRQRLLAAAGRFHSERAIVASSTTRSPAKATGDPHPRRHERAAGAARCRRPSSRCGAGDLRATGRTIDLVTHGYVVAESIAVARRRLGVDGVDHTPGRRPSCDRAAGGRTELPMQRAQARYRSSLPSGVSFVDQVSFALLEREGIHVALVLDTDFARPGITVLPPPSLIRRSVEPELDVHRVVRIEVGPARAAVGGALAVAVGEAAARQTLAAALLDRDDGVGRAGIGGQAQVVASGPP